MASSANILYSFRRCPYAMRARLAIRSSQLQVELREVVLRNKPPTMLAISAKATVPVLQLADGRVIDESWDIVHWASQQQDPAKLRGNQQRIDQAEQLISENDGDFKHWLDHYKYADRFPEFSAAHYREQAAPFLRQLDQRLARQPFLLDQQPSLADIGIFPFIRQFAHVDLDWFQQSPYPNLRRWFEFYLNSDLFSSIMQKHPAWQAGDKPLYF
ncbi:MAG: glutathione S-transferase [Cycloclasticus sp.]